MDIKNPAQLLGQDSYLIGYNYACASSEGFSVASTAGASATGLALREGLVLTLCCAAKST